MNGKSILDNMNIFRAFSEGMYNDNLEGFMEKIDENCEWVIIATGETFRGIDEIRQLALRSMGARKHTTEAHAEFTNAFSSEDQSRCVLSTTMEALLPKSGLDLLASILLWGQSST
jgi:hypothetical protein